MFQWGAFSQEKKKMLLVIHPTRIQSIEKKSTVGEAAVSEGFVNTL